MVISKKRARKKEKIIIQLTCLQSKALRNLHRAPNPIRERKKM